MNAVGVMLLLGGLPFPAAANVFCDNLNLVTATLPKNTSPSPVHFATATVSRTPDVVYALAFCRGDVVNDSARGKCVARTFDKILSWTPPEWQQCYRGAYYYGDPCTISFSSDNFLVPFNITENVAPFEKWNTKNITDDARLISSLIHELLTETVEKARTTPRRFATCAMDNGGTFPMVYSLAQCTPDLSAGDCLACLQRIVGMMNSTMPMPMGWQIHSIRCYIRYEAYARLPKKEKYKRRMSKLWAIPTVVIPVVAVAVLCFIFYSRWLSKGIFVSY